MKVSERGTVNYPAVEVEKPSLAGTFLDQKLCFEEVMTSCSSNIKWKINILLLNITLIKRLVGMRIIQSKVGNVENSNTNFKLIPNSNSECPRPL